MVGFALQLSVVLIEGSERTHRNGLAIHGICHSICTTPHWISTVRSIIIVNLKSLHCEKILAHYFKNYKNKYIIYI